MVEQPDRILAPLGPEVTAGFVLQDSSAWMKSSTPRIDNQDLHLVRQVHGSGGVYISQTAITQDRSEADWLWTTERECFLGVFVADCSAVLLVGEGPSGKVIAAIHAGWRGTAKGILSQAISEMGLRSGRAWISPSISAPNYEVGSDVRDALGAEAATFFVRQPNEKYLLDLKAFQSAQLEGLGLEVQTHPLCTWAQPELFSYRQARGRLTGRHLAFIRLNP